jgi:hypothetical protein
MICGLAELLFKDPERQQARKIIHDEDLARDGQAPVMVIALLT